MKTLLKLFLLFILATILYWGCMTLLGSMGISINIMFVFAMAVCAYLKPEFGYPTSFICGLFLDFFSVKLFGCNAFVFTLCATGVYAVDKRIDFDGIASQMISIFLLSLFAGIAQLLLLKVFAGFSAWNGLLPFVGGVILNALLSPVIFQGIRRIFVFEVKTS